MLTHTHTYIYIDIYIYICTFTYMYTPNPPPAHTDTHAIHKFVHAYRLQPLWDPRVPSPTT